MAATRTITLGLGIGMALLLGACVPAYRVIRTPKADLAGYGKLLVMKVDNASYLEGVDGDKALARERHAAREFADQMEDALVTWAEGWKGEDPGKTLTLKLRLLEHRIARDYGVYTEMGNLRYRVTLSEAKTVIGEATVEEIFGVAGFGNEDASEYHINALVGKVKKFILDHRSDQAQGD